MKKYLPTFFVVFLVLAFIYPLLGLLALICMFAPVLISLFAGRYWCGNYCPRGAFLASFLASFSLMKTPPAFMKTAPFRVLFFFSLISLFSWQIIQVWGNWTAVGFVFFRVVFLTTILGLILGYLYIPRTWCLFCPMGSLSNLLAPLNTQTLFVNNNCISCKKCSVVCPLQLQPYIAKNSFFQNLDCLKCGKCIDVCPTQALSFIKNPPA